MPPPLPARFCDRSAAGVTPSLPGWVLTLGAVLILAAGRAPAAPPTGAGWHLAWNDEFDGSGLDPSKWRHWLAGARRDAVNSPSAISVSDGTLRLATYTAGGTHYTGMIATDTTYLYTYGYIEARINYDSSPGMWSAFWMQSPTMGNPIGSPNSAGTEIDICEHRKTNSAGGSLDSLIVGNIHWDGYGADHRSTGYTSPSLGLGTGWHVYGMEWTPTQQKFYIDGTLRWTINDGSNSPVSQRSEFIILSSEVENGGWSGSVPAGGYGSPATTTTFMEVDYVRVFQRAETVVNGDFEGRLAPFGSTNQAAWSSAGGRTDPASARLAPTTSAGASVQQTVRGLLPDTRYTLTAWGDPGPTAPRLDIGARSHGGADAMQSLITPGYSRATVAFTTGLTNRTASLFASVPASGSIGFADDFLLRRGAALTNGQLEAASSLAWGSIYGGASVTADGTAYGGEFAWRIPAGTSAAGVEQEVTGLTPSTAYRLTGWTTNGNTGLAIGVKNHGGAQILTNVPASTWTRGTVNFTTGSANTTATLFAYRASSTATAYADAFLLSQPLTAPWVAQDVTDTPLDGIAGRLGDRFILQACGADIGGTSDRMHWVSQPVTGDTMLTARLVGLDHTSLTAKAGIIIRESNSSFVRSAFAGWSPAQTSEFTRRAAGSAPSTRETMTGVTTPPWLRLIRRGNLFTALTSRDGTVWSRLGTPQTLAMPAAVSLGLAACSGDTTLLTEAIFDDVSIAPPVPDVFITSPAEDSTLGDPAQLLRLTAVVTDAGTPVTAWSKVSGPGSVAFTDPARAETSASFSAPGIYVLRCSATTSAGTGSDQHTVTVSSVPLTDPSLALRLRLDESSGTAAADSSGNNNHAAVSGGLSWQPAGGIRNGAAVCNGTDSWLTVPDHATLDPSSAFTVSYWFKADAFTNAGLVSKRLTLSDNNTFSTFLGLDGKLNVDINTNNDRFTSATTFNRGLWYHIALVFDGTQAAASRARLYVNGTLDITENETSATVPAGTAPILLGILNAGTTAFFDGRLDEVRFYRRALSATEVSALARDTGPLATGALPDPARFAEWQALSWPGLSDSAIIGPQADPEKDGHANLLEWALHLLPLANDRPVAGLTRNGSNLEYTWTRRKTAPGEAAWQVEWSDSLTGAWSTANVVHATPVPLSATAESVRSTLPAGPDGRRYVRVRVTLP